MNYSDMMLSNMMFGLINKMTTGYIIIDVFYIMVITCIFQGSLKNKVFRMIESVYTYFDKTNKLIFISSEKQTSQRFRALMHHISKMNLPTVQILSENIEQKYNSKTDEYEETKQQHLLLHLILKGEYIIWRKKDRSLMERLFITRLYIWIFLHQHLK